MGTELLDRGLPSIWSKNPVEPDTHESGRDFSPLEVQVLDEMEQGRNEVVGKMKHDRGKGHAGGPALRRAIGRKRLTYVDGKAVWIPLRK